MEVRATILPYKPICLGYLRQLNPTFFIAIKATGEAENTEENSADSWEFSLLTIFNSETWIISCLNETYCKSPFSKIILNMFFFLLYVIENED